MKKVITINTLDTVDVRQVSIFKLYVAVQRIGDNILSIEILRELSIEKLNGHMWIPMHKQDGRCIENLITFGFPSDAIKDKMKQPNTSVYEFDSIKEVLKGALKDIID